MRMRKLLIATSNPGKLREMRDALGSVPFEIVSLEDVDPAVRADVEETGTTFEENARLKAKAYGDRSGLLTLADDSGLEVDALGGRPGVLTARYAPGSDEDRYRKLLQELHDVPDGKRGARFVAVAALYDPASGSMDVAEGSYAGSIMHSPRGMGGFGYDPVFFSDELQKSGAEMSVQEKNTVSHRGRAVKAIRDVLLQKYV